MNPFRRSPNPHLLQIPARPWVRRQAPSGVSPCLDAVPDAALDDIRHRGFHGVWLMGAWTTGAEGRRLALRHPDLRAAYDRLLPGWTEDDVGGSPYSIASYEPGRDLGDGAALARFRSRLRERGLGLMLDFVPNHLAVDHPWTNAHPERLVQGTAADIRSEPASWFRHVAPDGTERIFAHGRDPHFAGWTDTVQVDYRLAETRAAMSALLRDLARRCDGLRCDVAMLILESVFEDTWGPLSDPEPGDFWAEAIRDLRAEGHDTVLMAEAYWELRAVLEAGFDFTYDKGLYDELLACDAHAIRKRFAERRTLLAHGAHFLENHDEKRAFATFGENRIRSSAAVMFGVPGLRFFHEGQEDGRSIRIPVQLSREPDEPVIAWCRDFHERLWRWLADPLFHEGTWSPAEVLPAAPGDAAPPLIASRWGLGADVALLIANISPDFARGRVHADFGQDGAATIPLRDAIQGDHFERDSRELREQGLFVELGPWGAHFLRIGGSPGNG